MKTDKDVNGFEKPSIIWLDEKFSTLTLGSLKSSELEVYLAYMLMYQRSELDTDSFVLADRYGMSEQKVRRLQIEFAKRFSAREDGVKIISDGIFNTKTSDRILLDVSDDHRTISFSVKNAAWMHALKVEMANNGLTWREERNPRAITLGLNVFAYVFRKNMDKPLNDILKKDLALPDTDIGCKSVDDMSKETFLAWGKRHLPDILSVLASIGSIAETVVSWVK